MPLHIVPKALPLALVSLGSLACSVTGPQDALPSRASAPPLDDVQPPEEDAMLMRTRAKLDAIEIEGRGARRRELVRAGLTDGVPTWCGSFYHTNGYENHELDLGPDGFFYRYRSCLGTYAIAHGTIASVDGAHVLLHVDEEAALLEPIRSERGRSDFRWSPDLYVVRWGATRFVVPAELMEEFCRLADAGGCDSMQYADYPHVGGRDRIRKGTPWPLEGLPQVPARFRELLPQARDRRPSDGPPDDGPG